MGRTYAAARRADAGDAAATALGLRVPVFRRIGATPAATPGCRARVGWIRREIILTRASNPGRDTETDVFCNNKILEEIAEAWKNELWLG